MTPLIVFRSWCLALVSLWLVGCAASTPQTRIAKNPELYRSLTPRQQEVVAQGKITKGLPPGGVFLAWGKPDRVGRWNRNGRELERWFYFGYDPVYVQTYGVGLGWGYYDGYHGGWHGDPYPYWHGGSIVEWVPHTRRRVEFIGGKVENWEFRDER